MNEENLNSLQNSFSNNQSKLFSKINPLIGREAAIAIISLQGVERTSQAEIEVIANLISQFTPIKVLEFQDKPRRVVLSGEYKKYYGIRMTPQYKVANAKVNSQPWAIDLVIEMTRLIGGEYIKIASIGVEYDGYPAHYVESNIKITYKRDAHILGEKGISLVRISPEQWKIDPESFKKTIRKYLAHQAQIAENIRQAQIKENIKPHTERKEIELTPRQYNNENKTRKLNYIDCPICTGVGFLANDSCPICGGYGKISADDAAKIDHSEYEKFTCPNCKTNCNRGCYTCGGAGVISREKAIQLEKNKP